MGINIYWSHCAIAPMLGLYYHSSTPARKYWDSTPFLLSTSSPIPLSQAAFTMSDTVRSGKGKAWSGFSSLHSMPISCSYQAISLETGWGWGNKTGRAICCQGWGGLSLRPQRFGVQKFLAQNLVCDTHSTGVAVWLLVLPLGGHKSDEWGGSPHCQPVDDSLNVWKLPRGSFSRGNCGRRLRIKLMQLFIKLMRLKEEGWFDRKGEKVKGHGISPLLLPDFPGSERKTVNCDYSLAEL